VRRGLPRRRHAQVRATLGPGAGEIGMCQGLALIAEQEHDVAGLGLRLAQLEPRAPNRSTMANGRSVLMAAGQLTGGLAWLAISGEDAPDLIATAPLTARQVVQAKIEAVRRLYEADNA
jgi:hypothetical protein